MTTKVASTLCGSATVFVVQDVLRSVEHFRDALGFKTEFTYGEPAFYAGVERHRRQSLCFGMESKQPTGR